LLIELEKCSELTNGIVHCFNGTMGTPKDICAFSCNDDFELQGDKIKKCLANGNWSGGNPVCIAG